MMGLAGQNGLLEFGPAGREGLLYLENGKILHAETPAGAAGRPGANGSVNGSVNGSASAAGLKGLGALAHILLLSESDFRVLPLPRARAARDQPAREQRAHRGGALVRRAQALRGAFGHA